MQAHELLVKSFHQEKDVVSLSISLTDAHLTPCNSPTMMHHLSAPSDAAVIPQAEQQTLIAFKAVKLFP